MVDEFEDNDLDMQADAFDEMNKFDKKHGGADSSDEDHMAEFGQIFKPKSQADIMNEKNRILMERLIKA